MFPPGSAPEPKPVHELLVEARRGENEFTAIRYGRERVIGRGFFRSKWMRNDSIRASRDYRLTTARFFLCDSSILFLQA